MSSFAVGLLIGQMSVLIVLGILLKFFLFADSPAVKPLACTTQLDLPETGPKGPQPLESLLEQIYYDVDQHNAESMDWFTVLVALVIRTARRQAIENDNLLKLINKLIHSDEIPSYFGALQITQLDLGSDYPLLNNCRVVHDNSANGLEIQFDIDLKDKITLGLDTQLLLSYPKPMLAYLPVSGSVSLVNFSGRVRMSLVDCGDESYIRLSVDPNYSMGIKVNSLVGARAQLQNVPKIGQLVESGLRKLFTDRCVYPNYRKIKLPVWPKSVVEVKTTNLPNTSSSFTTGADRSFSSVHKVESQPPSISRDFLTAS